MNGPTTFSARHLDRAAADSAREIVEHRVRKLETIAPDLIACRVAVDRSLHRYVRPESDFHVRVVATFPPGKELVVTEDPDTDSHGDALPGLIRKAFHTLERMVKEERAIRRGDVKTHAPVARLR